MMCYRASSK